MLNFNEEELDTKTILARALIYLENSIYCIQNTRKENVSLLNSHYRYYLDFS